MKKIDGEAKGFFSYEGMIYALVGGKSVYEGKNILINRVAKPTM